MFCHAIDILVRLFHHKLKILYYQFCLVTQNHQAILWCEVPSPDHHYMLVQAERVKTLKTVSNCMLLKDKTAFMCCNAILMLVALCFSMGSNILISQGGGI
ncbi:hypothetical protein HOLleu_32236 [Holothuria leucospilota]|uniref:Uncharacterized protein n=1 Tax=Holothuria leucospilota TaxID=206669 RepID=A0A9Q0YR72_HOLLE|nr:hypothetical protein HOLleu_32236 [Holothuria leucospilota]